MSSTLEGTTTLIKPEDFLAALTASGIEFYAGVPDSLLKEFLTLLQVSVPADKHHITVNEGAAIGLASGYFLATNKIPLVYMQNSGLGNAVNPLLSLTHCLVYSIPMVLLIGHRGEPGTKDEPQHKAMGAATTAILEDLGIPHIKLGAGEENLTSLVSEAVERAQKSQTPVAIVVQAGSFDKSQKQIGKSAPQYGLKRLQVINALVAKLIGDEAIVASTGFNGRELCESRIAASQQHRGDFLNVGAMGHALPIALGIALGKPSGNVICIDGDGAVLMHLGNLVSVGKSNANVRHLLINNAAHESVGGQPTGGQSIDFAKIATLCGFKSSQKVEQESQLDAALDQFLSAPTPAFLEVRVDLGVKENLVRPSSDFQKSKSDFMEFLSENL